jgi:tetratricopeptide (TPR) repeat protein
MPLTPDAAAELLRESRRLNDERAYPALAQLLDSWSVEDLGVEPYLLFLRADVGRRIGRAEKAHADLDALDEATRRYGNVRLRRRRLNLLGSLQFEAGEVDQARDTWLTQLNDSASAGDEEFAARACNNLGVVATIRDDLPGALTYYARAASAYLQVGYTRGLGQAHHNLGITYREMGFLYQSDAHFRDADRLGRIASSEDEVARVAQERALLLYLLGDPMLARVTARSALDAYRALEDPVGVAEVRRVLGLVALGEGDLHEADAHFSGALEVARRLGARLLEGEVLAAQSALRSIREGGDAGAELSGEAEAVFDSLGAQAWGRKALDRAHAIAARGAVRPASIGGPHGDESGRPAE